MPQGKQAPIDTIYTIETPEGVDLHADLSGPVPRGLAFIVDFSIRALVVTILAIFLVSLGDAGYGILLASMFIIEWWYPVIFEVLKNGQTPGKKMYGLQVVNEDLTPVTWSASVVRNLLRAVDFLPMCYVLGLISVVSTRKFQRLGDLAAGTIVLQIPKLNDVDKLPLADPAPPPVALSEWEEDAVVQFTQRHESLSQARQEEIADILEPVTQKRGNDAVNYLRSVGNWLLGAAK